MQKIKKKFVNAFNQTYEVEVLPKEKVLEIVDNLIPEDIISNTWKNHIDSYGRTEARLNLEDGEIEYVNFTQGEGSIDTHYVILYTLPQNVVYLIYFTSECCRKFNVGMGRASIS